MSIHHYSHLTFDKGQSTYSVEDAASSTNSAGNTDYAHADK